MSRRLAWTVALAVAISVVIVAGLYGFANTNTGLRMIERTVAGLTGGTVAITGLSGHVPGDLHIARLELRDTEGAWLVASDITLVSSPARLLARHVQVSLLRAAQVLVIRAPASNPRAPARGSETSFDWHIDVESLTVPRLELGPALAGSDAILDVHGVVHLVGLDDINTSLAATRLDGPGTYSLAGKLDSSRIAVALDLAEPAGGPLANVIGLPGLGALAAHLRIEGPRAAETTHFSLTAGVLKAAADGTIDWSGGSADFDASASAPSMTLRPGLRWDELDLEGHFHGKFTAPTATARLSVTGAEFAGASFRKLRGDAHAEAGIATLTATLDGLRVPGPDPAVFSAQPVALTADARFVDSMWQSSYAIVHPLASVRGTLAGGAKPILTFNAVVPALRPFMRIVRIDLGGRATVDGSLVSDRGQLRAELRAAAGAIEGTDVWARLLQPSATVRLSASRQGSTLTIDRGVLDGGSVHASLEGADRDGVLDLRWELGLPKLAALGPALSGSAQVRGVLKGARDDFGGRASASADFAAHAAQRGHVDLEFAGEGLPHRPSATIQARGAIDGAPVDVMARITRAIGGGARAEIERAEWKSARASGEVEIPDDTRPMRGHLAMRMEQLEDLSRLTGEPWQGSVLGSVDFVGNASDGRAEVRVDARGVGIGERRVGTVVIAGRVDSPSNHARVDLRAIAEDIAVPPWRGRLDVTASGPPDGLALTVASKASDASGAPAELTATATANLGAEEFGISTLAATVRGHTVELKAPTSVSLRNGVSFSDTRLAVDGTELDAAGSLTPALDVTASIKDGSLAPLTVFFPAWQFDGSVAADLRLTGSFDAPEGSAHLHGSGLRLHGQSGRAVPATDVTGTVTLHDGSAAIDIRLKAATAAALEVTGSIPVHADGPLAMRATGQFALATANPFLEPNGRRIRGEATVDANLAGSYSAPTLTGTVRVEHGDLQDFVHDAHLTDISLSLDASERSLQLTRFVAHAGPGTISAQGTIGILEPTLPVSLTVTASNAQPLASDLLTARFNGKLTLTGGARATLAAAGAIQVERADINIPNALPREVAVLDVRRPHAPPPEPSPWTRAPLGLDIAISAPGQVFVRGRGLDTEVGGDLHVTGTTDDPSFAGGFDLRRGSLSLAGASLRFTSGRVSFNGESVHGALDPTLDFVAESTSDVTATLTVGGYASAPTITLTSVPELPQDEILSRLVFGEPSKQLTTFQMLGIGVGLASISGSGYGGTDPLVSIQKRLGLDRLAVGGGTGPDNSGATLEAGRYVSSRVYVGAVQSTTGITKLQAQIDLTKHLKLQTVVGNGSATAQGTTPQNDPGNTVGLVYQIDY